MLDKISYNILEELSQDGRISNAELARKFGISEATATKKVNSLIKNNIISIKAMANPHLMGYHYSAFIGLSVVLSKIDRVCDMLAENIHVQALTTSFGRFEILLIVFFLEHEMLQDFIKTDLSQIDGITGVKPYFIIYNKGKNNDFPPAISKKGKPVVLDKLNNNIIRELIRNGRQNYTDLAHKLKISKTTLSRRISSLLKTGAIKIVAIPNMSALGYSANAYILANAEHAKINNICKRLSHYPEVHLIMKLLNDFDILFGVNTANPDKLFEFLKEKVGNIDGILKTETFIRGDYSYFSTEVVFPPSMQY